jgi:ferredoxin-thioredoxin reductase catalytic subunit
MVANIPSCYCMLLMQPTQFKLSKLIIAFLCIPANVEMVANIPSCYCMLLMHATLSI